MNNGNETIKSLLLWVTVGTAVCEILQIRLRSGSRWQHNARSLPPPLHSTIRSSQILRDMILEKSSVCFVCVYHNYNWLIMKEHHISFPFSTRAFVVCYTLRLLLPQPINLSPVRVSFGNFGNWFLWKFIELDTTNLLKLSQLTNNRLKEIQLSYLSIYINDRK